ncbi:MAG: cation transporter [Victivallales bacterium]|nr:cation transporter [Victivallales bacterium]
MNSDSIRNITIGGMAANFVLSAVKLAIGLLFQSQACVADAVHSLSDCLTDLAVIVGVKYWSEPADADHPHGHGRIEALVTLFIGAALAVVAIKLGKNAITSIREAHPSLPGWPVFFAAVLSILAKEILFRLTLHVGHATHSSAVIANAWHHRSDAFSSIPVAVTALLCRIIPGGLPYLDAAAAVIVSLMLLITAGRILWPALQELADMGAVKSERALILSLAHSVDGIREIHELRTRRIGNGLSLDMHILVNPEMTVREGHDICNAVTDKLFACKKLKIIDVITHLEPWDEKERKEDQQS